VTFYVLGEGASDDRLGFACRLTEKVWKMQQRVHAHTLDAAASRRLDELLWTFRQGSFVPHEIASARPALAPVTIGTGDVAPPADLLINLDDSVPEFYARYARIAEIIDGSGDGREAGRARHRFYREQGLTPETHQVT
jgi:DNA polymerase-3 subunit chi